MKPCQTTVFHVENPNTARKGGSTDCQLEATYGQIRPSVSFVSEARAVRPMKDATRGTGFADWMWVVKGTIMKHPTTFQLVNHHRPDVEQHQYPYLSKSRTAYLM